jgi:uncharacterized protein YjiS (DUF1127 family)
LICSVANAHNERRPIRSNPMCVQALQGAALADRSPGALPETRTSVLGAFLNAVAAWIVRSGQRKALRELTQERRLLADIGLTREQALREAAKRFWRR